MSVPFRLSSLRTWLCTVALAYIVVDARANIVTINPIPDNSIYSNVPTGSNGAGDGLFVGNNAQGQARRALLRFDVAAAVPAASTIDSASLSMFVSLTIAGDATVSLHPVTASWGEGTSVGSGNGAQATPGDATWTHRFYDTTTWATPGGDFSPTVSGSAIVGAEDQSYTWASTPQMIVDVQSWLGSPSGNFGWIVVGDEGHTPSAKRFESRESAVASEWPMLIIQYTPTPEPALATWLALAGIGLMRRRRIRICR